MEELAHGAHAIQRPTIALRAALRRRDDADETLPTKAVLSLGSTDLNFEVEGEIELA
jgi:hypothetical protein